MNDSLNDSPKFGLNCFFCLTMQFIFSNQHACFSEIGCTMCCYAAERMC